MITCQHSVVIFQILAFIHLHLYNHTILTHTYQPDNSQHQNHGKNTRQEHVGEQHAPLECPTMGDQERFVADPARIYKEKKSKEAQAIIT